MSYTDLSIKKVDPNATYPKSTIVHGRAGVNSISGSTMGTFSGEVMLDPIIRNGELSVVNVNFQPCSRTNWHKHEGGQLLKVTGGSGWVCDFGGEPKRISVGDVIWCPPGGVHWHGADNGSFMVHEATSFGKIDWYGPVTDEEYASKK